MIVYIQPPNIYFEIAAYIHAEGMYGCVTRYLVLYMRFWSTCLFFMKPSLPASPITRCVRYPDRLVPGMYVLPTPPVNPERPVSGTPHLLNVLAPFLCTNLKEYTRLGHYEKLYFQEHTEKQPYLAT